MREGEREGGREGGRDIGIYTSYVHIVVRTCTCVFVQTCTCTCIISHRDKANPSNDARRQLFFFQEKKKSCLGRDLNLCSRQTLYQLSHRAGQAKSL